MKIINLFTRKQPSQKAELSELIEEANKICSNSFRISRWCSFSSFDVEGDFDWTNNTIVKIKTSSSDLTEAMHKFIVEARKRKHAVK